MSRTVRVSVGGGKGGVGKSLVAVNLAATLASWGMRVVIVDADLGTPTLHTLLGVDRVGPTLQALIERRITQLDEAVVATSVRGLSLVPGTSTAGAANLSHQEKLKLIRHVRAIDADVLVIDVGAGAAYNTLDLFGAGDIRLVVATSELTSLQNAYCFLRAALTRELRAIARGTGAEESWAAALDGRDTARIGAALDRLALDEPELVARARAQMSRFHARWVGNRVEGEHAKYAVNALSRLTREFLSLEAPVVAAIPPSRALERSVGERTPAVTSGRAEPALVRAFDQLGEHVVSTVVARRSLLPSVA